MMDFKKWTRRLSAIYTAALGGFDEVFEFVEEIKSLQSKFENMRAVAEGLQKERDKWADMWRTDGLGHANAQEMMAQEIDMLIQLLSQAVDALEQKDVDVSSWRTRMRGYANSKGFLEAVEKNREAFLSAASQGNLD
jgi:uncharacterized protein YukE